MEETLDGNRGVVLVIDDEITWHTLIRVNLQARGYVVRIVTSPQDGLSAVREGQIDLVIMNRRMPKADGLDVCREVRRVTDAPIVMVSGMARAEDRAAALEAGATRYLTKPAGIDEVLPVVEALVNDYRRSREAGAV